MEYLSNGKIRRSREEWEALITKFEQSNLSRSAFCERESLSESTFYQWYVRVRGKIGKKSVSKFVELQSPKEVPAIGAEVELSFRGGLVLRVRG